MNTTLTTHPNGKFLRMVDGDRLRRMVQLRTPLGSLIMVWASSIKTGADFFSALFKYARDIDSLIYRVRAEVILGQFIHRDADFILDPFFVESIRRLPNASNPKVLSLTDKKSIRSTSTSLTNTAHRTFMEEFSVVDMRAITFMTETR